MLTTMAYFKNIHSLAELKKEYRDWHWRTTPTKEAAPK